MKLNKREIDQVTYEGPGADYCWDTETLGRARRGEDAAAERAGEHKAPTVADLWERYRREYVEVRLTSTPRTTSRRRPKSRRDESFKSWNHASASGSTSTSAPAIELPRVFAVARLLIARPTNIIALIAFYLGVALIFVQIADVERGSFLK